MEINRRGIKDELRAGKTANQMIEEFSNQLIMAARELEKEKADAAHDKLDKSRAKIADAIIDHMVVLDVLPAKAKMDKNLNNSLCDKIKELEEEFLQISPLINILKGMGGNVVTVRKGENKDADSVIENFLKTLR